MWQFRDKVCGTTSFHAKISHCKLFLSVKISSSNELFSFQISPLDNNAKQQAAATPQQSQANTKPSWASLFGSATPETSKTNSDQAKFAPAPLMSTVSAPGSAPADEFSVTLGSE